MIGGDLTNKFNSSKIVSIDTAAQIARDAKAQNLKVGLCHGGFDLMHPGHIIHFEAARKLCDCLMVSVTSDRYVTQIKGKKRPILSEKLRAYSVAAIQFVNNVVISDTELGVYTIRTIKPTFIIKDDEFAEAIHPNKKNFNRRLYEEVKAVRECGGDIIFTSEPKLSTTEIMRYILGK